MSAATNRMLDGLMIELIFMMGRPPLEVAVIAAGEPGTIEQTAAAAMMKYSMDDDAAWEYLKRKFE